MFPQVLTGREDGAETDDQDVLTCSSSFLVSAILKNDASGGEPLWDPLLAGRLPGA